MMNPTKSFQEKSYHQQAEHFKNYTQDGEKAVHAKTWFAKDTVDAWRHQRMYQSLDPILVAEPQARWLTVGDGRYGNDAKYIEEKGCEALATDISEYLLKEAKDMGYLAQYQVENAESLSFEDAAFDYVFCKESYHHFPRPMLALYEMLRVAKHGVVLIEPNDSQIVDRYSIVLFQNLKNLIKRLLGKEISQHAFEESGNYVFSISRRELEKVAIALDYQTVAFKGINDAYLAGVEHEKLSAQGPLQKKTRRLIRVKDFLCQLGLMDYGLLAGDIVKSGVWQKIKRRPAGGQSSGCPPRPVVHL